MRTYIIAFVLSLLVSVLLTRLIRDAAIRWNLVDVPTGGRRIHKTPVPRLGGLAIIIAFAMPLIGLFYWDNRLSDALFADRALLISLVGGGGIILMAGIIDDLRGIRSLVKLAAQVAAALVVYYAGVRIEAVSVPFFSPVFLEYLSLPVTVFWVVLVTNAVNLIDGMDGLAGGVTVLAGGTLMIMSGIEGNILAALLLCCLVGATLGFLVYNLNPASIFMGDTGSLSLGFLLSLVSIHSSQKSYTLFSIVAAMLVLGLPIFDLMMAVVRRFLSGKPIFAADQHHIHHILLRKGLSQSQSVILLFGAAVVLETLAFVFIYADDRLSALAILALVPLAALTVRFLGYDRIIAAARRSRVMENVEEQTVHQSERVEVFRTLARSQPDLETLEAGLIAVASELDLEHLELELNFTLASGDDRLRLRWSRGGPQISGEQVHIQGLTTHCYPLHLGGLVFGELRLEVMRDREIFSPHALLLYQSIADTLTLMLAERSGALVPRSGNAPTASGKTEISWN
ncbi:MAG: MraY family glycosyltransferase [Myxococcota bacterium]|nr:MraY family glycosyltransferase [Myxococcota bacterium]